MMSRFVEAACKHAQIGIRNRRSHSFAIGVMAQIRNHAGGAEETCLQETFQRSRQKQLDRQELGAHGKSSLAETGSSDFHGVADRHLGAIPTLHSTEGLVRSRCKPTASDPTAH